MRVSVRIRVSTANNYEDWFDLMVDKYDHFFARVTRTYTVPSISYL